MHGYWVPDNNKDLSTFKHNRPSLFNCQCTNFGSIIYYTTNYVNCQYTLNKIKPIFQKNIKPEILQLNNYKISGSLTLLLNR